MDEEDEAAVDPLRLCLETGSESGESVVELQVETCCFCHVEFFSSEDLTRHLALDHLQHGLLQELLALGWEDGDLTCPQCGGRGEGEGLLLHWARHHGRVAALVRQCHHGGSCNLYKDKMACNEYLQGRTRPDVNMFPNSQLAKTIYRADKEEEEENVIVLDESESSDDDVEILEIEEESDFSNTNKKLIIDANPAKLVAESKQENSNNHNLVNTKERNYKCKLSENNDDQNIRTESEDEVLVETTLERNSQPETPTEMLSSKLLQVIKNENEANGVKSTNNVSLSSPAKDVAAEEKRETKLREIGGEEESLRTGTVCKICSKPFTSRRDFTDHLAAEHFRAELEREILRHSGGRPAVCPSCSLFKSKHLAAMVVHYGARCKPFPVTKLYSNWLSVSSLGLSTDICVFCGARAHSPNDLTFHLRDKHVAEVRDRMGFNYFFKFHQVNVECR